MLVISTLNNRTTPLAANAAYTGTGEVVSQYSTIRVVLRTNNVAPGTLFVGFSPDGVSWTETSTAVANPTTFVPIFVKVTANYFRLRYVNGATAQTAFRLQAELYAGESLAGAGVVGGSASVNVARQVITLTPAHITAKSFTIASAPLNPATLDFLPYGGIKQRYGTDFTVVGTTVSWGSMGLDGFLEANDIVEVTYFT